MPPVAQYALGLLITQSISSLSLNRLCRQVNFRIFTFYTQILPHHHQHFNALPARTNSRRHRETSQQATPSPTDTCNARSALDQARLASREDQGEGDNGGGGGGGYACE